MTDITNEEFYVEAANKMIEAYKSSAAMAQDAAIGPVEAERKVIGDIAERFETEEEREFATKEVTTLVTKAFEQIVQEADEADDQITEQEELPLEAPTVDGGADAE